MSKTWCLVVLVLGLGGCSSQPKIPAPAEAVACTTQPTRSGAGVRRYHGPDQSGQPLVVDIAPGEAACLPLEGQSGKLMFQMSSDSSGTQLRTHNPYADVLTYDALVYLDGDEGDGGYPSTTCPVRPGLTTFEHWEEPVRKVVLSRFALHPALSAPTACQ